jgi:hypothetical protein
MSRTLTVLFRRDPSRDRQGEKANFVGYVPLWPDGRPLAVGMDAFCKHGQRLLGLNKHLAGCQEKLINLVFLPLTSREDDLTRIPGHRVRRFFLERIGQQGTIHFMDGTPTTAVFDVDQDDPPVLTFLGLAGIADGDRQWFDLAAVELEPNPVVDEPVVVMARKATMENVA